MTRKALGNKLEGTGYITGWDRIGLMGMRIMMNRRILESERILVTLCLLSIRIFEAQKCEGEMRPPSPPVSLENLLVRGKFSCCTEESCKDSGLKNTDIHLSCKEANQFSSTALLLMARQEPSALKPALLRSLGRSYCAGSWSESWPHQ